MKHVLLGPFSSSPAVLLYLTAESVNTSLFFFAHFLPADGAGRGVHLSVQSLLHLPPRPGSRLL